MGSPTLETATATKAPGLNPAMVYSPVSGPTSPQGRGISPESQRLLGDEPGDGGGHRRPGSSVRFRFHLVNYLRLCIAVFSIVALGLIPGNTRFIVSAGIALLVFASLAMIYNAFLFIGWAVGSRLGDGGLCCSGKLPVLACQLGPCKLSCGGDGDDDGDEESRSPKKPRTSGNWVIDLAFALAFLVCTAVYNAQTNFTWWSRYYNGIYVAANVFLWLIFALLIIVAILQRFRFCREVTITIVAAEPDEDSHKYQIRLPGTPPQLSASGARRNLSIAA